MHLEPAHLSTPIAPPAIRTRRRPELARPAAPKDAALVNALTIIAHDLRGPLANLMVLIELIETYSEMRAIDRIKASTEKAGALIEALEALLDGFLERVRETGDPLSFRPGLVDATDILRDAATLSRPLAESRSIAIEVEAASPCAFSGDRRLLAQAADNLVSNAVKYSPPGSTVRCSASRDGGNVVLKVRDEGQGLTEEDLKRAFRPFATLSTRYSGRQSSWGLGLWIVRLIVERHGGHVDVSSGGKGGTCFSVSLPAARV